MQNSSKFGFLFSMTAALAIFSGCQAPEREAILAGEDGTIAPFIVAADAPPHTLEAAEDLAGIVERIAGARPEILAEPPVPLPQSTLWIGPHPQLEQTIPDIDWTLEEPEETLIVSRGGHVALVGRDQMAGDKQIMSGTANTVYSFAQDQLGVRWLWPGTSGEVLPAAKTIRIPAQVVRYAPRFLQRELFFRTDPIETEWVTRQRAQHYSYRAPMGHSFDDWWENYHQSNPEYFALQPDGTRSGYPQPNYAKVCEGEPGVWRQWLDNVAEKFAANPTIRVFGASQNDGSNAGICMDPRSMAWDHPDGPLQQYQWEGKVDSYVAMGDRMVRFANTLAEMLEERFPEEDLQVLVMAYGPSKPAPIEARTAHNVGIGYVGHFPISGDALRATEQEQFAGWAKMSDFIVYRPNLFYYSGGWHGLPVVTPTLAGKDFPFLADHNCRGIMIDGTPAHWSTQALQYYLFAQLAWDPYRDVNAVVDEFCAGFGPAAGLVREYFELFEQAQMAVLNHPEWRASMGIQAKMSDPILPETYSQDVLDRAESLLRQASEALADGPEIYRTRVDFLARGLEFTRLMMQTVLTMNEVRRSEGKNWRAVEEAVRLVEEREAFFKRENEAALDRSRPPAIGAHRIRNTWIATRKLEDFLGPVKDEFLQAAAAAKKAGAAVEEPSADRPPAPEATLAEPPTLRWTGAAGDRAWENRQNWEALTVTEEWVPAPAPPGSSTRVVLSSCPCGGDNSPGCACVAATTADPAGTVPCAEPQTEIIRLGNDAVAESITVAAVCPAAAYRIESRPDDTGGIDAESGRIYALELTGVNPVRQTTDARADLEFDVEVRFADPAAAIELPAEHGAEVRFLRNQPPGARLPAADFLRRIATAGPVVLFGDSTTALREGCKTYGEQMASALRTWNVDVEIINSGVGGNTTAMARERFDRDVLAQQPALVVVQFGINDSAVDVWKDPPATGPRVALSAFLENLEFFVDRIREQGGEVLLMTPNPLRWTPNLRELYAKPPYNPGDPDGMNVLLNEYAEGVRGLARAKEVALVDVHAAYPRFEEETGTAADALLLDGMHPNSRGHELVNRLLFAAFATQANDQSHK